MPNKEPLEVECWVDPTTDNVLVKIRKWENGKHHTKRGIILIVRDNALYPLCEGATYPMYTLPNVEKTDG